LPCWRVSVWFMVWSFWSMFGVVFVLGIMCNLLLLFVIYLSLYRLIRY
jgi:hypothetical protein